jgi:hypothetical protein
MKTIAVAVFFLVLLASQSVSTSAVAGSGDLALAAVVAEHSPLLSPDDKQALARVFAGDLNLPDKTILVRADAIVCKAGNVDISSRSCELTFGANKVERTGRKAHELFATFLEVGVPSEGAAGHSYASLSQLICTINLHDIKERGGGGANCKFKPGAP